MALFRQVAVDVPAGKSAASRIAALPKAVAACVLLIALLCTCVFVTAAFAADVAKTPTPAPAEDKTGVVLSGQLSRVTAGPREVVRFWITIENHSDKPVRQIWLEHLDVPGFNLIRRCWSDGRTDAACYGPNEPQAPAIASCDASSGADARGRANDAANELCEELPARHSLTVWGDLAYADATPRATDFAVVRWTADNYVSRSAIPLGPMETFGRARSLWEVVTTQWQIGIPVWLAIFSAIYALWKNWRDDLASKRSTESAQQRNTWNLLLLKVHRLAFQHYMPIVSTAQGILLYMDRLEKAKGDPAENSVGAFCYLLRFHWRIRQMKRSGASWYFKSLTAEELVVGLYQSHRRSLGLSDLNRQAALDEFLDAFDKETTVAQLLVYLRGPLSAMQSLFWDDFQTWLSDFPARREDALLSAMTKVITYETNRPYYYWYEELRAMELDEREETKIREVASGDAKFSARVERYLLEVSADKRLS